MSTETGRQAEALVEECLAGLGLTVIERNWRTRWCEVDLIARGPDNITHFVEVKYRRSDQFGSGFEYISSDKARRLRAAALSWQSLMGEHGPYQIDIVAVMGDLADPRIDFLDNAVQD